MIDPRDEYGFPYLAFDSAAQFLTKLAAAHPGAWLIGYGRTATKLERAQAIAAEVRARRFPPVTKFTTPKD